MHNPSIIALIPARGGSRRIPGKNIRQLQGHPLLSYTIAAAQQSGIFSKVIVSTDTEEIARIAVTYGAEVPWLRSPQLATDTSVDFDWIEDLLTKLKQQGEEYDCFSILRPTSPLRQPETIQRAWNTFLSTPTLDSLRAVEKCKQHPGKMWVLDQEVLRPLLTGKETSLGSQPLNFTTPWHSTPYQALPLIYIQNASLEMAWCRVIWQDHTIAGQTIGAFLTQGYEGLDLNDPEDWWYLEYLLAQGEIQLPTITL